MFASELAVRTRRVLTPNCTLQGSQAALSAQAGTGVAHPLFLFALQLTVILVYQFARLMLYTVTERFVAFVVPLVRADA